MAKAKSAAETDSSAEFLATLTELNKVANRTNLASVQAKTMTKRSGAAAKGAVGAESVNVCAVYGKARPILDLILKLPFIPAKAKDIVRTLMSLLDVMCPR